MQPIEARGSDSTVQQITEVSRSLKQLARELDVPVIALSQLSRAVEQRGGQPKLSDLRDSGCLAGNTLITRADTGERVPIKNLVGETDIPVFSLNDHYKLEVRHISNVFSSGYKKLYELKTRSGRRIKASGNHSFYTLSGWSRLDQLAEKQFIALPRTQQITPENDALSRDELVLLAHLIGDGCVLSRQSIHYTNEDKENIDVVANTAHRLFGISPRIVEQQNWYHVYLPSPYHLTHGVRHPITEWYESLRLERVRAPHKRLPSAIFQCGLDAIRLFLHHLWSTDGNVSEKSLHGRQPSIAIYYATSSAHLADDIQHLLLRLGIQSTVRPVAQGQHKTNYHVLIQNRDNQLTFCRTIGCFGKRGKQIPHAIRALESINTNVNTDVIPSNVWREYVEPRKDELGMSWRDVATIRGRAYNGSAVMKTAVSRPRCAELAQQLEDEQLLEIASSELYWDEIVSIEPLHTEEVFDATVPGTHNFVANDIIVHNSIEQDADVVMFIHRENDSETDEDYEQQNIAKILIEKHRNGPTGIAELYFNDKKTTFQSLQKGDYDGAEEEFADF
jgi:replicative DNA helicase